MLARLCPLCGVGCETSLSDRVNTLCSLCVATATWEQLLAAAQTMIDDAIRRGGIPGLLAMRAVDPPINLPRALDVLEYRHRAGIRPCDASS